MIRFKKYIHVMERMIEYCDEIYEAVTHFGKSYEIFSNNSVYFNASCLCILQIGELVNQLREEFLVKYHKIPWEKIRATRNMIAHEYKDINKKKIWNTIENDIPELKAYCMEVLEDLNNNI